MVIEISMNELANRVNILLKKGKVGEEFSFGECFSCGCAMYDPKHCNDYNETDIEGWHCATKISDTEVAVRYMGGVCFGLITDTCVDDDDMECYMRSATNFGFEDGGVVYMEIE